MCIRDRDKDINDGGPPYGTTVEEVKSLFKDGWILESEEFHKESIKARQFREKLIIFLSITEKLFLFSMQIMDLLKDT